MDSFHHNIFSGGCNLLGAGGHPVCQPFFQQSDAAGADKRIVIFNLLGGRIHKIFGIAFQASLSADRQKTGGKVLIPIFPQRNCTEICVFLQAFKNTRSNFQRSQIRRGRVQQRLKGCLKILHHLILYLMQQVINICIVGIESPAVEIRPVAQFLYGDALDRFFPQQPGKGLADQHTGKPDPLVVSGHKYVSFPSKTDRMCRICPVSFSLQKSCLLNAAHCGQYNTIRNKTQHCVEKCKFVWRHLCRNGGAAAMKKLFIVTGAGGHLGGTIIRQLEGGQNEVRGLLFRDEKKTDGENTHYYRGDVRDAESLRPLFEGCGDKETIVIHTAGLIDISNHVSPELYDVNVNGTKNILTLCREYQVKRLVYVSSVHAIPERKEKGVTGETQRFSPAYVTGGYAKTKAAATRIVLQAAKRGLDVVVVHPSGILGPYDRSGNHLVQMVAEYLNGTLPACVKGGYDFVDVRDVAQGCLLAAEKGRNGECYILSDRYCEIREVLAIAGAAAGKKMLPVLPIWMAKIAAPFIQLHARRKKRRPLYTAYSLHVLGSGERFSHKKATDELGYHPRDLQETIRDMVTDLQALPA